MPVRNDQIHAQAEKLDRLDSAAAEKVIRDYDMDVKLVMPCFNEAYYAWKAILAQRNAPTRIGIAK